MNTDQDIVVYWDASAVLAALFRDVHSEEAHAWSRLETVHVLSSLAWAEVHAVIARLQRERALADVLADAARETLDVGPWRRLRVSPDWLLTRRLAAKWPLRGADLWHLAAVATLRHDLPELVLLTFDNRLRAAGQGEGLTPINTA